ncbi:alanine--tRNA ligase, partial [bacterium]|nr:alanine--tRNA ligase [bacterium]
SLSAREDNLLERVGALQEEIKKLNKDVRKARQSKASTSVDDLLAKAEEADGIRIVAARIDDADPAQLRQLADEIKQKASAVVCVLGSVQADKVSLLCAVSEGEAKRVQAGAVIKQVAAIVGGSGGGRPDLAQAGGKQPEKLDEAIAQAMKIVRDLIK